MADGTTQEQTETYMFVRGTSKYVAGSRFRCMEPVIKFNYESLVEAIHKAIDKEQEEYGEDAVAKQDVNIYKDTSTKEDFNTVMTRFGTLSQSLVEQQVPPAQITAIIEDVLGKGRRVGDCTPDQQELVELINSKLQEISNNIK